MLDGRRRVDDDGGMFLCLGSNDMGSNVGQYMAESSSATFQRDAMTVDGISDVDPEDDVESSFKRDDKEDE